MKGGLALILGKAAPSKGGPPMPDDEAKTSPEDDEAGEDSGAREYAKLFVDAMKGGDDEAAIDALVGLHSCK